MPAEVHDAQAYDIFSQDEVLFDANVWLYLEGPPGQPQSLIDGYSALLERILIRQCGLVAAPLVLSEFVNRYIAIEYNAWAHRRNKSRKEFRSSGAFKSVLASIDQACKNILSKSNRTVRQSITLAELRDDAATFGAGGHDLNDLVVARYCRKENLILVTHDADFASFDELTIITCNRRLLHS